MNDGTKDLNTGEETRKRYSIIYADPPWAYLWGTGKDGGHFAPEKHYPTMTTEEICALKVRELRAPNCVLALWTTSPCLPDAFEVLKAWGFKYKTMLFVWLKLNPVAGTIVCGPGSYTRSACEYVILGMRGHIKRVSTKPISQILEAPRGRHSAKPAIVRDLLVELFGDLPRVELFARQQVPGWDAFGNEIGSSIPIAACDVSSDDMSSRSAYIEFDRVSKVKNQAPQQPVLFETI